MDQAGCLSDHAAGTVSPMQPGRNLVTPSDVGKRVSFQFELPNGYVGEALGRLEAYDEGAATFMVRTRDGDLVRVPLRGVRFGKVVSA